MSEVELRVASCEHREKAQKNFPVSVCVKGKKGEAQQGAAAALLGHRGEYFVRTIRESSGSCCFLVQMTECR